MKLAKQHLKIGIAAYFIFFTAVSFYKYWLLAYNGMDLAIFNNVFFNAVSGNGFWSSIQGHHYFADHFAPLLVLLMPFYYLWQSPLLLLAVQSLLLGLTAWPVYLVAKKIINEKWGVGLALIWLINPLLWNVNIHEWHVIPWAIPLLLLAYYYYLQCDLKKFLLLIALSLLVREDVVVVTSMFSLLALVEKRNWRWIIYPGLLSTAYFAFTMKLIAMLRPGGSRFLTYYDWILTGNLKDWLVHLFGLGSLEMALGLSLAFLFLPWLKPKYLLLSLGVFLQFALTSQSGGNIATDTHYASLFLPGLIIASLWSIKKLLSTNNRLARLLRFDPPVTKLALAGCLLYLVLVLGPGYGIIKNIITTPPFQTEQKLLTKIPKEVVVAASYRYLPQLSSRTELYPLHYIMLGHQQYSSEIYTYQPPDFIILEIAELPMYELQFRRSRFGLKYYPQGYENLAQLINRGYRVKEFNSRFIIWAKDKNKPPLETTYPRQQLQKKEKPINFGPLSLRRYKHNGLLRLAWQENFNLEENYFLQVSGKNFNYLRPLLLFYPTQNWQQDMIYESAIYLPPGEKEVYIQLIKLTGLIELDSWRSIKQNWKKELIGQPLRLH